MRTPFFARAFERAPRHILLSLALVCSASCGKTANSSNVTQPTGTQPPTQREQACARGFTLTPDTLNGCGARHKDACYPSIEDACACAGCGKCMVLESQPVLVACGG